MFSTKTFHLSVLWIDFDSVQSQGTSFVLTTPEDRLYLVADNTRGRDFWLQTIKYTQCQLFTIRFDNHNADVNRAENSCHDRSRVSSTSTATVSDEQQQFCQLKRNTLLAISCDESADVFIQDYFIVNQRQCEYHFKNHRLYKDAVYNGQWVGPHPNGEGVMICSNGTRYSGIFKDGVCHGVATMEEPSSGTIAVASGTWEHGLLDGHACVLYHDKSKYFGEWYDGKKHGYGVFTAANGAVYRGQWREGVRSGYGTEVFSNYTYAGFWQQNLWDGFGLLVTEHDLYEGEFHSGKLSGPALIESQLKDVRFIFSIAIISVPEAHALYSE